MIWFWTSESHRVPCVIAVLQPEQPIPVENAAFLENHSIAGSFATQEGQIVWLQKELKQRTKESSQESPISRVSSHWACLCLVCLLSKPTAVNRRSHDFLWSLPDLPASLHRRKYQGDSGGQGQGATAALEKPVLTANSRYPSIQLCLLAQVYTNQHGGDSFRKKQSF